MQINYGWYTHFQTSIHSDNLTIKTIPIPANLTCVGNIQKDYYDHFFGPSDLEHPFKYGINLRFDEGQSNVLYKMYHLITKRDKKEKSFFRMLL